MNQLTYILIVNSVMDDMIPTWVTTLSSAGDRTLGAVIILYPARHVYKVIVLHNLQYIVVWPIIKFMGQIKFSTKEKRERAVTVRLKTSTLEKLRRLAKAYRASQADIIESLIESADPPKKKS